MSLQTFFGFYSSLCAVLELFNQSPSLSANTLYSRYSPGGLFISFANKKDDYVRLIVPPNLNN